MPSAPQSTSIVLREIESIDEVRALGPLQTKVWGEDERDIVPLHQFVAASWVGGSLIGAFDGRELAGFVYGFYGHIGGRIVHHSHMLAVDPDYRRHNLGFRLKAAQRDLVLADRVADRITWTFDPLQSLNAHFNFAKLGVISDTYKINVYGEQGVSFLHRNGTDRLFVTWLLDSPRVRKCMSGGKEPLEEGRIESGRNALRLLHNSSSGYPEPQANIADAVSSGFAAIEIPADINMLEREDFDMARKWREETRRVFSEALSEGFTVVDYFLESERSGSYLLKKVRADRLGS